MTEPATPKLPEPTLVQRLRGRADAADNCNAAGKPLPERASLLREAAAALTALAEREAGYREALTYALDHVVELRDAWARGCISEHDGHGGMRSNRNVEVEQQLRAALREGGAP